jgi:hypothetical protein
MPKKKIWANFQRFVEHFTKKIVTKTSKILVWERGSGKNLFRIPDPGVKKAPDPDPQHCLFLYPATYLNKKKITFSSRGLVVLSI